MSSEDEVTRSIMSKIEREKALITAANAMRQSTNNPSVLQGIDHKIRDGRKNIEYLESRLREHQMRQMTQKMDSMNMDQAGYGDQSGYPDGQGYSQLSGGNSMMPPNAPFARQPPGSNVPKPRPNYSRLGMYTSDQSCRVFLANIGFKISSNTIHLISVLEYNLCWLNWNSN
jgi:hypothetical protein